MVLDYCSQNAFFGKGDCALLDFASTDFQDFLIFPNFLGSSFLWFWAIHEATYMKFFLLDIRFHSVTLLAETLK